MAFWNLFFHSMASSDGWYQYGHDPSKGPFPSEQGVPSHGYAATNSNSVNSMSVSRGYGAGAVPPNNAGMNSNPYFPSAPYGYGQNSPSPVAPDSSNIMGGFGAISPTSFPDSSSTCKTSWKEALLIGNIDGSEPPLLEGTKASRAQSCLCSLIWCICRAWNKFWSYGSKGNCARLLASV